MAKKNESVLVLFTQRSILGSAIIRTVTWSEWSHCDLIMPGNQVLIGASAPHGVVETKIEERAKISRRFAIMEFPVKDAEAVYSYAKSQIGKPYDWFGVAGIGLHRNWADDDKWFCSEFVAAAINKGKKPIFREDVLSRITPQHLWMLPNITKGNYPWVKNYFNLESWEQY